MLFQILSGPLKFNGNFLYDIFIFKFFLISLYQIKIFVEKSDLNLRAVMLFLILHHFYLKDPIIRGFII